MSLAAFVIAAFAALAGGLWWLANGRLPTWAVAALSLFTFWLVSALLAMLIGG